MQISLPKPISDYKKLCALIYVYQSTLKILKLLRKRFIFNMILLYILVTFNLYVASTAIHAGPSLPANKNANSKSLDQNGNRDGKRKYNHSFLLNVL